MEKYPDFKFVWLFTGLFLFVYFVLKMYSLTLILLLLRIPSPPPPHPNLYVSYCSIQANTKYPSV